MNRRAQKANPSKLKELLERVEQLEKENLVLRTQVKDQDFIINVMKARDKFLGEKLEKLKLHTEKTIRLTSTTQDFTQHVHADGIKVIGEVFGDQNQKENGQE